MALFADGSYTGPIVLPADADGPTKKAAELLKDTLKQITGVEPTVTPLAPDAPLPERCIVLGGALAERANAKLPANLKDDGFVVKTKGDRLILAGAPPRGTLYAAADFLERELGCRWFDDKRIVIPRQQRIEVAVADRRDEPALAHRIPYDTPIPEHAGRQTTTRTMFKAWRDGSDEWGTITQNRGGSVHGFHSLIVPPKKNFKDHPEYFSNHFGNKRGGVWYHEYGQLNYHNDDVRKLAVEYVRKNLDDNPRLGGMLVSQMDWFGWSEDPTTNAFDARYGSVAASHVDFINEIAESMAETHPDKYLTTLAYLYTHQPPAELRYPSNVRLYVCQPDGTWGHAISRAGRFGQEYFDSLKTWAQKSDTTLTWCYYHFGIPVFYLCPDIAGLPDDLRAIRDAGLEGFFAEVHTKSKKRPARQPKEYFGPLRAYTLARLAWNPDLDLDAFLADFHAKYFGPKSGPVMLEFCREAITGVDTYRPAAWPDEKLDKLESIATRALAEPDDDFARREILRSLRAVTVMKLMKRVGPWRLEGDRWTNGHDNAGVPALLKRFDELTKQIGDDETIPAEKLRYEHHAVVLKNDDTKLTIVPEGGGTVAQIIDRKTGQDYASLLDSRIGGILVGGYQELSGAQWSAPGIKNAFEVVKATPDSVTLAVDVPKKGVRLERTISLLDGEPGFRVDSKMVNISKKTARRAFRTHPMFQIGRAEDVVFAYRDRQGKNHAGPIKCNECLSAEWGPTGTWAMVNPKENRGLLWQSPPVHNGHYIWANPFHNILACETFSEHAELEPGEALDMTQTFTILRDARAWAKRENMPIVFDPADEANLPKPNAHGRRVTLRPLSKAEKWHRANGLFFSGWYSQDIDDPKQFGPYKDLYPHAMPTNRKGIENAKLLAEAKMPWMYIMERGPFMTREHWKAGTIPDVPREMEVGYCVDEDLHWMRDKDKGRMKANIMRVARANEARPSALTCIGLHAHSRQYGCIRIADLCRPDVVAGEVYPFLHTWNHAGSLFWQLTWAREAGMRTGRPWWNFIQTFGRASPSESGKGVRLPSESEMRLQVFAALAWGYTGFFDYVYTFSPKFYADPERSNTRALLVEPDGTPTKAYADQKQIIAETMNLGRGLSQLRHLDVGFWADRHRLLRGLGVDIDEAKLTLGRFCDDTGDDSYVLLASTISHAKKRSEDLTQTVTLRVDPPRDVLELDRRTGKVIRHKLKADAPDQPATLELTLPGGTATLLKIDNGKPFALLDKPMSNP